MPKKKKTRKQKTLADVRRQTAPAPTHTATSTSKPPAREEHIPVSPTPLTILHTKPAVSNRITTEDYRYLGGDVRKTLLLTVAIIGIELGIKFGTGI